MKLYLLRHGQTEGNAKMVIQGWTPTPLTAQGKKQAERLRDLLADMEGFADDLMGRIALEFQDPGRGA